MRRWAVRLRQYSTELIVGSGLALLVALAWVMLSPTRLSVAVPRHNGTESGVMAAYARALAQHDKGIRLRLDTVGDYRQAAEALERRAVDLALVRSDVSYPGNGLTAAIMGRRH